MRDLDREVVGGERRHRCHDRPDAAADAADEKARQRQGQGQGAETRRDDQRAGLCVDGPALGLGAGGTGIVERDDLFQRQGRAPPRRHALGLVEGQRLCLLAGARQDENRLGRLGEGLPVLHEGLVEAALFRRADQELVVLRRAIDLLPPLGDVLVDDRHGLRVAAEDVTQEARGVAPGQGIDLTGLLDAREPIRLDLDEGAVDPRGAVEACQADRAEEQEQDRERPDQLAANGKITSRHGFPSAKMCASLRRDGILCVSD
ncbi:hypothetical protein LKMONMHP_4597 [Methylobacterium organophilum]|uniref:Uncharacterized protein n=1 Tax=Methylobacterium organophilum TaxID=410 RepID=A0ABQ4TEL6_METOR|nr:hypothetical protein LKMONMHP_4597 [Methylobacterium organophilum]